VRVGPSRVLICGTKITLAKQTDVTEPERPRRSRRSARVEGQQPGPHRSLDWRDRPAAQLATDALGASAQRRQLEHRLHILRRFCIPCLPTIHSNRGTCSTTSCTSTSYHEGGQSLVSSGGPFVVSPDKRSLALPFPGSIGPTCRRHQRSTRSRCPSGMVDSLS
jgi:hypothetical protein